ncbi:hypothetical protein MUN53_14345 [Parabacteroides sp. AGMB00274]|uniref:Uncharacterized protein n=1 Tax=Parabacteroides faecalis TaxID=2924040 RepID=A0ABT0C441_9BACT|nr:hypothetical protein [Parabacteroides faecalis]MCJ2381769.1 hypothetical protein [Parabacteroides faecalis]
MSSVNLNELRDKTFQCSVVHGWHEKNLSDEHFLCLVISELMEAVEADRKGKRAQVEKFKECQGDSIPLTEETRQRRFKEDFEAYIKGSVEEELADACIRLLDLSGLRNVDLGEVDVDELKCSEGFFDWTFTESIFFLVCNLTNTDFIETHSFDSYLRVALMEIIGFCVKKDIDIFWYIDQKMKYNELLPYKHEGKSY